VIPPVLPIWLLAGLPPDLEGAPHGWPPTADDSVRRATPLDLAAAAAAAATTPDEAGRSGSSRTCHLRSNHRAHHPLLQAGPRLGHATAAASRAGRPLDLAGPGGLCPAAPGPSGRRRSAAAVGAAPMPAAAVTGASPPRVSAAAGPAGFAGKCAETGRMPARPAQRPLFGTRQALPGDQEAHQEAPEEADQDREGGLTGSARRSPVDLGPRPTQHARRLNHKLSSADSTQAYVVDAEHQPTDLAVGGSNPRYGQELWIAGLDDHAATSSDSSGRSTITPCRIWLPRARARPGAAHSPPASGPGRPQAA
jgi:hypothetical protein